MCVCSVPFFKQKPINSASDIGRLTCGVFSSPPPQVIKSLSHEISLDQSSTIKIKILIISKILPVIGFVLLYIIKNGSTKA